MVEKVNLRDSYKYYKANNPNPIDVKIYLYIVVGFITFLVQKLIEGFDIELAGGKSLGTIGIRGRKPDVIIDKEGNIRLPKDYGATNKMWKENPELKEQRQYVYHTNEHTNGLCYRVYWWQYGMKIANKRLYYIDICKGTSRKIAASIKSGKEYAVTLQKYKEHE